MEIDELNGTHSGDWSCLVQGQKGNHTRTVSIYVIAHDTKYCPMNGEEAELWGLCDGEGEGGIIAL